MRDITELVAFVFVGFGWCFITQGVFLSDPVKAWVVAGAGLMCFGAVVWFRGPVKKEVKDVVP